MCVCVDVRSVALVVEAFDILLQMCHSQSLNLFVESFLAMVQKLLECCEPDMQCLAVDSVRSVDVVLKSTYVQLWVCRIMDQSPLQDYY